MTTAAAARDDGDDGHDDDVGDEDDEDDVGDED